MNDTNPFAGVVIGLLMLVVGTVIIMMPERLQMLARRNLRSRWANHLPFRMYRAYLEGPEYIVSMRVVGSICVAVSLFVLTVSILSFR